MERTRRFADAFAGLLRSHSVSPAEAARRIGVSETMVSRWRRGISAPTWENVQRIADVFQADADTLWSLVSLRASEPVARQQDSPPEFDPATQAELDSYRQWYDTLIRNKVPRGMWRAYTEACDQLAESFRSVGQAALSSLPDEKRDGPDGEPWKPLTFRELAPLCQLAA